MSVGVDLFQKNNEYNASRRFGWAALAMNLAVYPLLALWTVTGILCFPPAFVLWKLVAGWGAGKIMRHFIWIYGRGWLLIMKPFVKFRCEGFENLRMDEPSLLVVNHLSFFDTYCMALLPAFDITFAVRAWPFRMLWYGWFMRLAGYLDVESKDWRGIRCSAADIVAKGGHLLFFPEGHRSRTGGLQRFHSGAFRLAENLSVPLIPLCIMGTDRLLPPGRFWLRPTEITLRALAPVGGKALAGGEGARELRRMVQDRMAENLAQMRESGT